MWHFFAIIKPIVKSADCHRSRSSNQPIVIDIVLGIAKLYVTCCSNTAQHRCSDLFAWVSIHASVQLRLTWQIMRRKTSHVHRWIPKIKPYAAEASVCDINTDLLHEWHTITTCLRAADNTAAARTRLTWRTRMFVTQNVCERRTRDPTDDAYLRTNGRRHTRSDVIQVKRAKTESGSSLCLALLGTCSDSLCVCVSAVFAVCITDRRPFITALFSGCRHTRNTYGAQTCTNSDQIYYP